MCTYIRSVFNGTLLELCALISDKFSARRSGARARAHVGVLPARGALRRGRGLGARGERGEQRHPGRGEPGGLQQPRAGRAHRHGGPAEERPSEREGRI